MPESEKNPRTRIRNYGFSIFAAPLRFAAHEVTSVHIWLFVISLLCNNLFCFVFFYLSYSFFVRSFFSGISAEYNKAIQKTCFFQLEYQFSVKSASRFFFVCVSFFMRNSKTADRHCLSANNIWGENFLNGLSALDSFKWQSSDLYVIRLPFDITFMVITHWSFDRSDWNIEARDDLA